MGSEVSNAEILAALRGIEGRLENVESDVKQVIALDQKMISTDERVQSLKQELAAVYVRLNTIEKNESRKSGKQDTINGVLKWGATLAGSLAAFLLIDKLGG